MKKVFLTAVALATFGYSQAQDKTSTQVTFGAKAGINFATFYLSEDHLTDSKPLVGVHVGGFVNIPLSEKVSFQPELLYSMQGYKEELKSKDENYDGKTAVNYLNVPLNFQFVLVDKLFMEAGPQIGFLLSSKSEYTYSYTTGGVTTTISDSEDTKEAFKGTDFGFNLGAGYHFTEKLSANLRYTFGLSAIDEVEGVDMSNRVLQLTIGYSF